MIFANTTGIISMAHRSNPAGCLLSYDLKALAFTCVKKWEEYYFMLCKNYMNYKSQCHK